MNQRSICCKAPANGVVVIGNYELVLCGLHQGVWKTIQFQHDSKYLHQSGKPAVGQQQH